MNKLRPVILKAPRALAVGESYSSDEVGVRVTAALPGGFSVEVEDRRAPLPSGGLASYGDAGTPGNVSNPVVVGFGGWQAFPHVFAGRDATGQDRIYAVVA